jgi:hypothetical protein
VLWQIARIGSEYWYFTAPSSSSIAEKSMSWEAMVQMSQFLQDVLKNNGSRLGPSSSIMEQKSIADSCSIDRMPTVFSLGYWSGFP